MLCEGEIRRQVFRRFDFGYKNSKNIIRVLVETCSVKKTMIKDVKQPITRDKIK